MSRWPFRQTPRKQNSSLGGAEAVAQKITEADIQEIMRINNELREALLKMFEQDANMNWRYSRVECAKIAADVVK